MLLNKDEMAALKNKSETEEAMSPGGKAMDYAGMSRPAARPMPMRGGQRCAAGADAVASKQELVSGTRSKRRRCVAFTAQHS